MVVVLSSTTVEHLGGLVRAGWNGTVVAVGSVEEAREVIGGDGTSDRGGPASSGPDGRTGARPAPQHGSANGSVDGRHPDARGGGQPSTPAAPAVAGAGEQGVPVAVPAVLRLDRDRRRAVNGTRSCPLTPLEFGVLDALLARPGQVRTSEDLTRTVWRTAHTGDSSHLHAVVRRLRRKLRSVDSPLELVVVRGVGFRLAPTPAAG